MLLLSSDRVLVSAASLAAMAACLAGSKTQTAGPDAVIPSRLADLSPDVVGPVHTLRGYERLENGFLADPRSSLPTRSSLHPIALLTSAAFERLSRQTPETLFTEQETEAPELATATAGLFHEFIDYYGEVRRDVLPFIPEGTRDVLEVGCGRGVTGKFLREELGCRVTGVELNPVIAREAMENLDRVIQGDVEDLEIEGRFDAVIALELFEHLVEPETFLARARRWLRPRGRIVLSVPNVGHYSVVEDLLAGRWDYLPIGLLCYTHLRFFTRRTLEDWLCRCGFERFDLVSQRSEETPLLKALTAIVESSATKGLEIDPDSLNTKGFFVVIRI